MLNRRVLVGTPENLPAFPSTGDVVVGTMVVVVELRCGWRPLVLAALPLGFLLVGTGFGSPFPDVLLVLVRDDDLVSTILFLFFEK